MTKRQVRSLFLVTATLVVLALLLVSAANHVFLPGHRLMVQIQSNWFPLYDRNPQTFVPNIFWAKPGHYRKATQPIYSGSGDDPKLAGFIELPLVTIP
jgi:uncharacterized protein